jgi:hypothetical protein
VSSLTIIRELKINFYNKYDYQTCIQINNDFLLIADDLYVYMINLKKFTINLKIENNDYITHCFKLDDQSIIICDHKAAKRLSSKTLELIEYFFNIRDEGIDPHTLKFMSYLNYIKNTLQINKSTIVIIFRNFYCQAFNISI